MRLPTHQKVDGHRKTVWLYFEDERPGEGDPNFPVNAVKYKGINVWFNEVFTKYCCTKYYFNQPEELSIRFRLEISRAFMIQPKPKFVECPLYNEDDIMSVVWHSIKSENIQVDKGSEIIKALEVMKDSDKDMVPAVYALGMCLLGFERFPWRKPFENPIQEIIIPSGI